jgi:OmpA-OmpF porin, OOP family
VRLRVPASGLALATLVALVATGCTKRTRVAARPRTKVDALSGTHFAYDKDTLTPQGRAKVRNLAATLNQHGKRRIEVNGYTDAMGTEEHNQRLSERRAYTVMQALVEDGVAAGRVRVHGYGEANPVASNATAEGRAQNRRVEIILE